MLDRVAGEQGYDLIGAGQATLCALVGWQPGDVGSEQLDLPGIGAEVAANLVEQSGLAGAVRPDDQPSLARLNHERNILGDGQAAEGFSQADDFKRRASHGLFLRKAA